MKEKWVNEKAQLLEMFPMLNVCSSSVNLMLSAVSDFGPHFNDL